MDITDPKIDNFDVEAIAFLQAKQVDDKQQNRVRRPFLNGDFSNIVILLFFYSLQAIPLGLSIAIPIILQDRGSITYEDQAGYSFVTYPFSFKLLWAPIVDSLYWKKFGRRKSWLIPVQCTIGILMLIISYKSEEWLGDDEGTKKANIMLLTISFFCFNFLAATQDIAVDAWAISMLKRENVGHASTCNTIGHAVGVFLGYVVFVTLVSPQFCNKWIRNVPQPTGIVSFSDYMYFWGVIFIVSTTLIAIFKSEKTDESAEEDNSKRLSIAQTYKLLIDILRLQPVKEYALILLTAKIGFAATDATTSLKLIDKGVSKDKLALLSIPSLFLQMILPIVISKHVIGPRPLSIYLKFIPFRLFLGLVIGSVVYGTQFMITKNNIPLYYYGILIITFGAYQVSVFGMMVPMTGFFARISDPNSGGTYMTLLNTLANLGGTWTSTVSLWLVDKLTWKFCATNHICLSSGNQTAACHNRTTCSTVFDGYYTELFCCTILGIIWFILTRKKMYKLQNLDSSEWRIIRDPFADSDKVQLST